MNNALLPARRLSALLSLLSAVACLMANAPDASAQFRAEKFTDEREVRVNADRDFVPFDGRIDLRHSTKWAWLFPDLGSFDAPRPRGTTGVSTWNGGTGNWSDGSMWTP